MRPARLLCIAALLTACAAPPPKGSESGGAGGAGGSGGEAAAPRDGGGGSRAPATTSSGVGGAQASGAGGGAQASGGAGGAPASSGAGGSGGCNPASCDDGNACNGLEICDPFLGACVAGKPPACDDGLACNGVETCDAKAGCQPGSNPACTGACAFDCLLAQAMKWARRVAESDTWDWDCLHNALIDEIASHDDGPCPVGERQPSLCGQHIVAKSSFAGPCTTADGHAVSGTLTSYLGDLSPWVSGVYESKLDALAFELAGAVDTLAVDGTLGQEGSSILNSGKSNFHTTTASAKLGVRASSSVASLSPLLRPGKNVFSLTVTHTSPPSDLTTKGTGQATAHATTAPWVASFDMTWDQKACATERDGWVKVEVWDKPGGSVQATAKLTFDGLTSCDGCGILEHDGVVIDTCAK
jgi:hypothetical protein